MSHSQSVPTPRWRLHIGAHKTATTHLQHTLNQMEDDLLGKGIDVLMPKHAREITQSVVRRRNQLLDHVGLPVAAY